MGNLNTIKYNKRIIMSISVSVVKKMHGRVQLTLYFICLHLY